MKPKTERAISSLILGLIIFLIIANVLTLFYLSQPKFIMTDTTTTTQTDLISLPDRNSSLNNPTEQVDLFMSAPTTTVTPNTYTKHLNKTVSTTTTTTIPNCGGSFESPCTGNKCGIGLKIGSRGVCQPVTRGGSVPSGREGCSLPPRPSYASTSTETPRAVFIPMYKEIIKNFPLRDYDFEEYNCRDMSRDLCKELRLQKQGKCFICFGLYNRTGHHAWVRLQLPDHSLVYLESTLGCIIPPEYYETDYDEWECR